MSQSDRTVLCMKWGTLFPPDYVNVLYNACHTAITGPFRFVCLTDDGAGLDDGIDVLPIPDIGLTEAEWFTPGVWPKLSLYVPQLHDIRGRCLFIDLDMVVLGGLDEMFDHSAPFIGIGVGPGWHPGAKETHPRHLGTGIFAFEAGAHVNVLEAFQHDKSAARASFANEQDFVLGHVEDVQYWEPGWVLSFKRYLRRPMLVDLVLPPKSPPATAKVVAFHGDPRPIDLISDRAGFWDKFPHMGHGPVGWVCDYWVKNGGRIPPFE
ncbi:hypothetical protein [Shimia sp.]|uniref:hypothetical protein n=1 Tax=Shimia sp. TaxID=1954381 RepID=UPI0032994F3B